MKHQHEGQWNQFQLSVNSQTLSCKNAKAAEFFSPFRAHVAIPARLAGFFLQSWTRRMLLNEAAAASVDRNTSLGL